MVKKIAEMDPMNRKLAVSLISYDGKEMTKMFCSYFSHSSLPSW